MTRHLLKLIWKQKRANALLTIEIFFSFIVLVAVATIAAAVIMRYRRPLGFDYHNVWVAGVAFSEQAGAENRNSQRSHLAVIDRMLTELRSLPEIESAAACVTPPYSPGTWESKGEYNGVRFDFTRDNVTDDFAKVMHVRLLAGRWFGPEDDAAEVPPIVLDADAARQFGARGAVGQLVELGKDSRFRIIGVIAPFRTSGELSRDRVNMAFGRVSLRDPSRMMPHYILMRVHPGVQAVFEQTLTRQLHAIAPDYAVRMVRMDSMRMHLNRGFALPAMLGAIVAVFLIVMVFLGLSGVLWQNVTRRTREIGLRRALGATGSSVYRQILIEVGFLSTLPVVIALFLVAQLPILGLFRVVTPEAFGVGIGCAVATIYALTLLCGAYPSWLASTIDPAEALRYE